jgi:fengycin family lipopeptide synthetase D
MSHRNYDKLVVAAEQNVKERDYWLEKLSGDLVKSCFPYDRKHKAANDAGRETVKITFSRGMVSQLMKLSKGSDIKLHMILAAGLAALLGKYTGNNDGIFGVPIYAQEAEIEFINTVLVLRNQIQANMTFKELLLQVRKTIIEATENQNYPVEILLEQLGIPYRHEDDFPLFDAALLYERIHEKKYLGVVGHNVLFAFNQANGHIEGALEYNPALYEKGTVERIVSHYNRLLEHLVFHVDTPLSGIDLLSEEEKQRILYEFNDTDVEYRETVTLQAWFEEQVEKSPDVTALVSEELLHDLQLTYRQLDKRSNQLARLLKDRGVGHGTIVGLMVEKSLEMMVGIWGILKAGAAYLPIDLAYPHGRIQYMLKESNTRILLTYARDTLPVEVGANPELELEFIDILSPAIYRGDSFKGEEINRLEDPAYIIYTSGSTGKPKGVVVEHRNVVAYLNAFYREFEITGADTALQQTSYSFDAFLEEVYPVLFRGGKVVICPKYVILDSDALPRFILKHCITFISVSPLLLNEIDKLSDTGSIRIFISGGDVLKKEYTANLLKKENVVVYNTYGPTETAVCTTYYRCSPGDGENPPIGKPISNYKVYILDQIGSLLPIGVPGELSISGAGVARGYLNKPELTVEKFINKSFCGVQGRFFQKEPLAAGASMLLDPIARPGGFPTQQTASQTLRGCTCHVPAGGIFYKTGDLARWLSDGNIEFLGRMDNQVKIRGFRIELGEIENQLLKHEAVNAALVLTKEMNGGQQHLCAYAAAGEHLSISQLREYLAAHLPDYMVPSYFVLLDKMPLTPNGKPDIKALGSYQPAAGTGAEYIAPGTDTERLVAGIWQEVLHLDKVSINDNFFDLGGNSLLLLKAANKLKETFQKDIRYVAMFQYTTVHSLSGYLNTLTAGETGDSGSDKYLEQAETLDRGKDRMKRLVRQTREAVNG